LRGLARRVHILTPWNEQAEAMRLRFAELGYGAVSGARLAADTWNSQLAAIDAADIVLVGTMSGALTPVERDGDVAATAWGRTPLSRPTVSVSPPAPIDRTGQSLVPASDSPAPFEGDNAPRIDYRGPLDVAPVPSDALLARRAMKYASARRKTVIHVSLRAPYDVVNFDDIADASLATFSYYGFADGLRGPSMPALVDVVTGIRPGTGRLPVDVVTLGADGLPGTVRYPRGFRAPD
jgi:beta-N-acetylhexosaminidase